LVRVAAPTGLKGNAPRQVTLALASVRQKGRRESVALSLAVASNWSRHIGSGLERDENWSNLVA
jgi:hypothetical protein